MHDKGKPNEITNPERFQIIWHRCDEDQKLCQPFQFKSSSSKI